MFKTITLTEKELAIFINARCWEDIKYITQKDLMNILLSIGMTKNIICIELTK